MVICSTSEGDLNWFSGSGKTSLLRIIAGEDDDYIGVEGKQHVLE